MPRVRSPTRFGSPFPHVIPSQYLAQKAWSASDEYSCPRKAVTACRLASVEPYGASTEERFGAVRRGSAWSLRHALTRVSPTE